MAEIDSLAPATNDAAPAELREVVTQQLEEVYMLDALLAALSAYVDNMAEDENQWKLKRLLKLANEKAGGIEIALANAV